jgi:CheY-like chemotaxis protein
MHNILLIENDFSNIELIKAIVKGICNLEIALNYQEAIKIANQQVYNAIVLDIHLGNGPDGLETYKEIRKIEGYLDVPVIIVTAFATHPEKEKILESGINSFLTKPININLFKLTLNKVLFK